MTHGAVYDQSPLIRWIFHAHTPEIWRKHFSSEAQESRKRGEAPLSSNKGFNLMR